MEANQMAIDEKVSAEAVVRDIRRQTRKKYSAEEKIRIVLEGLRGEDSIAEADEVVMRWRVCGTHRGEFMGIPATGRKVAMTGMTIGRMAGNKIIEGWTNWDLFALMQQLGVLPMPDLAG